MAEALISCPNLAALADHLRSLTQRLDGPLATANGIIVDTVRQELPGIYTPRLAKHWQIENSVGAPTKVRVFTTSPYVYGYEYGTRPHTIVPRNAQALRFAVGGQTLFRRRVQHPGTKGHHRAESLKTLLGMAARAAWEDALATALEA